MMQDIILKVNAKFCRMLKYDLAKAHISAGVMLWDEYRLYSWRENNRPANMIVDVGGHYGSFTAMAKTVWPDSTVRAYEPHPYSAGEFRANTSEFNGVTLIEAALVSSSYGCETINLYLSPGDNDGGHTVLLPSNRDSITVRAISILDDLRSIDSPSIDILKLDCEGLEADILEDLRVGGYLPKIDFITGEWHNLENVPKIIGTLSGTHLVEMCSVEESVLGAFFAWRKN